MKVVFLAILSLVAFSTPSGAKCHFDSFRMVFGFDGAQTGQADSGKECSIHPQAFAGAGIESITIVRQPKHGSATSNFSISDATITYKSAPGYKGPDDFVYAEKGGGSRFHGTSNIKASMTVN
jgi:hypothetical protein